HSDAGLSTCGGQHVLYVGEGADEGLDPGALEVGLLPVELPGPGVLRDHREAAVVEGARVERAQLGPRLVDDPEAVLDRHPGPAAAGDRHDRVGGVLDALEVV